MWDRSAIRTLARVLLAVGSVLTLVVAAGCASSNDKPTGLTISGPGLQTAKPPWHPEYVHLRERIRQLGLPPVGKETFHIHAMLHIYVEGLLVPLPADIGIVKAKRLETSLHTHDGSGIIHMEADHRFNFTLGDFFAVWGVKLGPAQVGGLTGAGGDHLHFYLNGKPLANPAAHVLHREDSIVIGYGPDDSFPHAPPTYLLKEVEKGEGSLGCGKTRSGQHRRSCVAFKPKTT
jgi:hypothetical protein